MNRRHAMAAGFGLASFAAFPASAQTAAGGDAEMKHAAETLAAGSVALETSKIALKKAKHAWVKKFAEFEVAEQETIAEVLKAASTQPGKADDKDAAAIKKLQDAGDTFDRDYLAAQLDGHQKLLKIQETYISSGKNKEHVGMAKLARGQIKEHIELLKMIQKEAKA